MTKAPQSKINVIQAILNKHLPYEPTVDYRAQIVWKDGIPELVSAPVCLSEAPQNALVALLKKALDLPYDGPDPTLVGLSQGEAMIINLSRDAANGDRYARETVLDRLLGRPQQNIKTEGIHLKGDLNTFLDKVAEATRTVETVTVVPEEPEESMEDL